MATITGITKKTENPFVNLYELDRKSKTGKEGKYYVASRAKSEKDLKLVTGKNAINDFVYEFPAGLVEKQEPYKEAAVREMKEETGLEFTPITVNEAYEKPAFTTVGMTDESCAIVFGTSAGEITKEFQEDTEEIEVVLADREEVKRILKEEKVAIMCSYMLMHFIHDKEPFEFLKEL